MSKVRTHLGVQWDEKAFGVMVHHTGTLCGRRSNAGEDMNCEQDRKLVTCRECLRIIKTPNDWRHRKHLTTKGAAT